MKLKESLGVPVDRARKNGWVWLPGVLTRAATETRAAWQPLPGAFKLWWSAFWFGGWRLLRAVEQRRAAWFVQPARCSRFLSIGYVTPPSALHAELAWLREMGVRQVALTLDASSTAGIQRMKALGAIQNLHSEECRVGAVLCQKAGPEADPEVWHGFCVEMLAQVGWQLEQAQIGEGLAPRFREKGDEARFAGMFTCLPGLRRDYPGVAFVSPCQGEIRSARNVRTLQRMLPDGYAWDYLATRAPAWQVLESVGLDHLFLRHITLAAAVSSLPGVGSGGVQIVFPPAPDGCDEAGFERIAGSIVRRTVLALVSGSAQRVVAGVDPTLPVERRATFTTAVGGLIRQLEGARFNRRVWIGNPSRDFLFEFTQIDGRPLLVGWTDGAPRLLKGSFQVRSACDYLGRNVPLLPYPRIRLTRTVAYFVG